MKYAESIEVAKLISDVGPLLKDSTHTQFLATTCLQETAVDYQYIEPLDELDSLFKTLDNLRLKERELICDGLTAAVRNRLSNLRRVRSYSGADLRAQFKDIHFGRAAILKAFGTTDNPVRGVNDVQATGHFL